MKMEQLIENARFKEKLAEELYAAIDNHTEAMVEDVTIEMMEVDGDVINIYPYVDLGDCGPYLLEKRTDLRTLAPHLIDPDTRGEDLMTDEREQDFIKTDWHAETVRIRHFLLETNQCLDVYCYDPADGRLYYEPAKAVMSSDRGIEDMLIDDRVDICVNGFWSMEVLCDHDALVALIEANPEIENFREDPSIDAFSVHLDKESLLGQ